MDDKMKSCRIFTAYRPNVPTTTHDENQRNAPDEPQFQGVVFSDGTVAIRWLTAKRSTSVWQSLDDAMAIHGHPEYGSYLVWNDEIKPHCTKNPQECHRVRCHVPNKCADKDPQVLIEALEVAISDFRQVVWEEDLNVKIAVALDAIVDIEQALKQWRGE